MPPGTWPSRRECRSRLARDWAGPANSHLLLEHGLTEGPTRPPNVHPDHVGFRGENRAALLVQPFDRLVADVGDDLASLRNQVLDPQTGNRLKVVQHMGNIVGMLTRLVSYPQEISVAEMGERLTAILRTVQVCNPTSMISFPMPAFRLPVPAREVSPGQGRGIGHW